jgi:hypothetical protein
MVVPEKSFEAMIFPGAENAGFVRSIPVSMIRIVLPLPVHPRLQA